MKDFLRLGCGVGGGGENWGDDVQGVRFINQKGMLVAEPESSFLFPFLSPCFHLILIICVGKHVHTH